MGFLKIRGPGIDVCVLLKSASENATIPDLTLEVAVGRILSFGHHDIYSYSTYISAFTTRGGYGKLAVVSLETPIYFGPSVRNTPSRIHGPLEDDLRHVASLRVTVPFEPYRAVQPLEFGICAAAES